MPFSPLVSPRVTGRVLAADTGAPLAGVKVTSGKHAEGFRGGMPPKGGELLMAKAPVRTGHDGRFTLQTERVLTPFRGAGLFSVQLAFERAGQNPQVAVGLVFQPLCHREDGDASAQEWPDFAGVDWNTTGGYRDNSSFESYNLDASVTKHWASNSRALACGSTVAAWRSAR